MHPCGTRYFRHGLMNGTKDPLVPFAGGESSLLGLFYKGGYVMSSRESAQFFAGINALAGAPVTRSTDQADGIRVEQMLWQNNAKPEVELVAIEGGGHGLPQPYWRRPQATRAIAYGAERACDDLGIFRTPETLRCNVADAANSTPHSRINSQMGLQPARNVRRPLLISIATSRRLRRPSRPRHAVYRSVFR